MRRLGSTESSATTTFYFTVTGATVSAVLLPFYWQQPSGLQWVLLIMIGVVSGGAQMMMTLGYRFAPAAIVAPFDYSARSEEHTSELQSLMRISYAVFCLKKKKIIK